MQSSSRLPPYPTRPDIQANDPPNPARTTFGHSSVHRGLPPQPNHWPSNSSSPNPPLSHPTLLSSGPSRDPTIDPTTTTSRSRLPLDFSVTDQSFLVASSGSAPPNSHHNQTTTPYYGHVGHDNTRSRPLPVPASSTSTLKAQPDTSSSFSLPNIPYDPSRSIGNSINGQAGSSRPLPTAPSERPNRCENSPHRANTVSSALYQNSQKHSVSVRDRVLALQQAGLQNHSQRRALPQSPTAPPDLSQIPASVLRRRGTLPNPPVITPSINHRHSQAQSHEASSQLPENSATNHPPSTDIGSLFRPQARQDKISDIKDGDYRALGIVIDDEPTIPETPDHKQSSNTIISNKPPDEDYCLLDTSTNHLDTEQRYANSGRTPEQKPIRGGPRKMYSSKSSDKSSTFNPTSVGEEANSVFLEMQRSKQSMGSQSLTLQMATMALGERSGTRSKSVCDGHDDLEDSPPRPLRPLSPQNISEPHRAKHSYQFSKTKGSESSNEGSSSSSRPAIPKITFGVEVDSASDSSDSDSADGPETPSFTISAAPPTIAISSSETATVPSIMVALDASPAQSHKRHVPIRAIIRKGGLFCGGCGESIVGRIVSAMGVRWHPSCFQCTICGELLEHVSAYEHEGLPYCHLDYHENFAPQCFHCKTPIVDEQFITLDDLSLGKRTYHEQHFFCAECGDPFLGPSGIPNDDDVGFTVYKGYAYCEACHVRLRMPKCSKCRKSIRDGMKAVEALGGKWHQRCFACAGCERPFDEPAFFQRGNKPFCEKCFSIIVKSELD